MLEYIPIEKENIPYRFEIELEAEVFEMEIRYNDLYDFFTIDLYKDGEPLVYGEKVVYGVPLFQDVRDSRFPAVDIVPKDEAGLENQVTYENFQKTVFLAVVR
ncbi:hypothetical protein HNR63_001110 [Anoxybacillus kamchatkensis]|uniref:phage baseplate plug family protein n=1 Tax=Anoxybacillus ayderensis TaxID=265546 RepID=UPI0015EBBE6B|nr:hypothetical protein [Anoxybacillus ayderensis]MBA2878056.1 hypothetical protein [Anoxybacillus ayderensis]